VLRFDQFNYNTDQTVYLYAVDDTRSEGDRVVVHPGNDEIGRIGNGGAQGGLTPRLLVTEAARPGRLFRVPESVPLDVAAFAEPLAVGMRAVEQADVAPGDAVAVFGCGPIGLAAVATLLDRGVDRVVAIDLSATRRELALGLGAQAALDPAAVDVWEELARLHGTKPFMTTRTPATDAFIEASGAARVITDVIARGPVGGRLSVVALHYAPIPTSAMSARMLSATLRYVSVIHEIWMSDCFFGGTTATLRSLG